MSDKAQITFPFMRLHAPRSASAKALVPAPRPVARRSAVRVPDGPDQASLPFARATPRLFVHEGARQLLEKRMASLIGDNVALSVTDNRRTMISSRRRGGTLEVRVHHMFLDADVFTVRALARYVRHGDRAASVLVGRFIESHRQRIAASGTRQVTLRTEGEHHDLGAVFERLNVQYFGGIVDARATWGRRRSGRRSRATIKLGTYCAEQKLIRIHPSLDRKWVPRYFVAYIMYHEMLHHVVPMPVIEGRRQFHSEEYRARERAFADYERAIRWEKRWVHRLLRA